MNVRFSAAVLFAAAVSLVGTSVHAQGTLTASQATAGAKVYAQSCQQCHGAKLEGGAGPTLTGSAFTQKYPTPSSLYNFVHKNMPLGAPGSLSTTQYQQVTAYLLKQNGKLGK